MTDPLQPDSPLRLRRRVAAFLFATLLAGATVRAQLIRPKDGESVAPFEVATIKPNNRDVGNSHREQIWWNDSSYRIQNLTLRRIIRVASGAASGAQLIGGPDPLLDSRWDINAKIDDNDYAQMQKLARDDRSRQLRLMLQALLTDRFQLKVHIETKTLPLFALVVAKGGAKLQPSAPDEPAAGASANPASANPASATSADQRAASISAIPPVAQRHQGVSVHSDSHKVDMTATDASLDAIVNVLANSPEIDGRLVCGQNRPRRQIRLDNALAATEHVRYGGRGWIEAPRRPRSRRSLPLHRTQRTARSRVEIGERSSRNRRRRYRPTPITKLSA